MKRLLFVVLLLAGIPFAPAGPAQAASGACVGTSGVTVVVQFPDHTDVRCALGHPDTGRDALRGAGFHVTVVTKFGGAVCQIEYYPDTPCENMPPASAYWTYYHANPGGGWVKSDYGFASTHPKPGSYEGWRFGDGSKKPDYAVPAAPAPAPTPHPTAAHPSSHATPAGSSPAVKPPAPAGRAPGGASSSAPGAPDSTKPAVTPSPTGTQTPGAASTATDDAAQPPSAQAEDGPVSAPLRQSDQSSSKAWIGGLVLIALLAGGAAAAALRRRRA